MLNVAVDRISSKILNIVIKNQIRLEINPKIDAKVIEKPQGLLNTNRTTTNTVEKC